MSLPSPASGPPPDSEAFPSRPQAPPAAGRDIDAWPLAVPRHHDEQFERWLGRVSHRYGVSLSQIVRTMALPSYVQDNTIGMVMAVMLDYAQFARTVGVPYNHTDELKDPDEVGLAVGTAVDKLRALKPRTVGRWCPACLATSGYWRGQWLDWWALACPVHRLELVSQCPNCGQMPWSSKAWIFRAGPVDRCPEKLPGSRRYDQCGADLTRAPAETVDPLLLRTQLRFDQLFDRTFDAPYEHITIGDFTVPRTMFLHALCCVAAAVAGQYGTGSDDSSRIVRALAEAFELFEDLIAGRSSEALDTLLGPSGLLDPLTSEWDTTRSIPNPVLTAATLRRGEDRMGPGDHLLFRFGRNHPALPPAQLDISLDGRVGLRDLLPDHRTVPLTVPTQWVPQQLWPEVVDGIGEEPAVRGALAICLLRLGRDIHTGALALELGLPWGTAVDVDSEIARMLGHHGWPQLLHTLERIASELHRAPPPIDYRARRIIGARPELLDAALTTANRRSGREKLTPEVRARFWERFTGNDIAWAPVGLSRPFRDTTAYTGYVQTRYEYDIQWDTTFRSALDRLRRLSELPVIGPLDWMPPWLSGTSRLTAASWQRFPYEHLFDDKATDPGPLLAYVVLAALVPDWEAEDHASSMSGWASERYRLIHEVPVLLQRGKPRSRIAPHPGEEHVGRMVAHTCGNPAAPTLDLALPHLHRWPHRTT
ncbi:TniQ family protein [Nocardia flavorosea]|uniref:TniQ domain-containing protein n=1 Tax=Nocardia flavorosea TaxID=53429 RepID=A0A846YR24_9NOCA|nr:TniQ family protein [Nocardia flavorosea]NKY59409.1 hypothetical protein [Nocardia flavorosea]